MCPKVNYGLWVIMICQGRFINCNNKCTTTVGGGVLVMEEAGHVRGRECMGNLSIPSLVLL